MTPLLGLGFDDLGVRDAARLLAARPAEDRFAYVVTPNADHLVRLHRRPALREVYRGAMLILLDSRVVAGAARLLRLPCPAVAPGSDLAAEIIGCHVSPGERITIIGLRAALLPALVARCGLAPPAHFDPPLGFEADPDAWAAAVGFALSNPARFTFLAVGSPRQELLAQAIAATGRATGVGLCVGASLEFLAGGRARAPGWMRACGLEWLHRLAGERRRLARRYLVDSPPVFALLLRERMARLVDRPGRAASTSRRIRSGSVPR